MSSKLILKNRRRSWLYAWAGIDWWLLGAYITMTLFGGLMIQSVERNQGLTDWWQHWITGGIGLVLAMIIARCRYESLLQWRWIIYGLTIISLIFVQIVGTTALGAQRWINIAGFHVQPSEFAKVGLIITLAACLHSLYKIRLRDFFQILAIAAVPWGLVFMEPNLGTSLILGSITMGMLYWANVNPGWLVLLIAPIISAILFN
ncbi:MAG: FtsW/RodA/SpoVE family cell cycle protein, partial [Microcoleaceae cyanobacterium]